MRQGVVMRDQRGVSRSERLTALEARVIALEARVHRLIVLLASSGILVLIGKAARWW
jgi:hypothetical protein